MAWIESHQELRDHPKTNRLARYLGIPKSQVIGHLHMLWWWAIDYTEFGLISPDTDAQDIADACEWEEDAKTFVWALREAGWVDEVPETNFLFLHDWLDYCGSMMKRRYKNQVAKHDSVIEIEAYIGGIVAAGSPEQLRLVEFASMSATREPTDPTDRTDPKERPSVRDGLPPPRPAEGDIHFQKIPDVKMRSRMLEMAQKNWDGRHG